MNSTHRMRYFLLFVLTTILSSFQSSDFITIKIRYQKKGETTTYSNGSDRLILKSGHTIISDTLTTINGELRISKQLLIKHETIDVFLASIGVDENYLISLNTTSDKEIIILLPKAYEKKGKFALCPKCHKNNKVYIAAYGLSQISRMIIKDEDTTYSPIVGRKYYMGSCTSNDLSPNWYCDRDKIHF